MSIFRWLSTSLEFVKLISRYVGSTASWGIGPSEIGRGIGKSEYTYIPVKKSLLTMHENYSTTKLYVQQDWMTKFIHWDNVLIMCNLYDVNAVVTCDTGTESDEGERSWWIEMSHSAIEPFWQCSAWRCSERCCSCKLQSLCILCSYDTIWYDTKDLTCVSGACLCARMYLHIL